MKKTYRAAVIGCGRIGAGVDRYSAKLQPWAHASVYAQDPRTELVALVDVDSTRKEKLARDFPGVPFFTDSREMMEMAKPEIVSIATLPESHGELVDLVSTLGVKAILCEKPIAADAAEAERMIAACEARQVPLFINHIRRYDPEIRAGKAALDAKGPVMQAHAQYTRGIHNNGTHIIDLLRFFLGEVVEVIGQRNTMTETFVDLPGDWNIDGLLTFASGARATIQTIDANAYSIFDFDFYAKEGRVSLKHFGFRVEDAGTRPCSGFIGHKEVDDLGAKSHGMVRSLMVPVVAHIVACLDGFDAPVSSGEDGLAALLVIDALVESARQGGNPIHLHSKIDKMAKIGVNVEGG